MLGAMRLPVLVLPILLALTGCGSRLAVGIRVANALGAASVAAGVQVNADFDAAEKACLFAPAGETSPLPLAAQRSCLDKTEASYRPALLAYDDFLAIWPLVATLVHTEEARELMGGAPVLDQIEALLPRLIDVASKFNAAYLALQSPKLPPLPTKGAP